MSRIKDVRTTIYEWIGPVAPMPPHFCTAASDLVADITGSISGFRFLGWLVVEIEFDDGVIGIGNAALSPHATKTTIDTYLKPLLIGADPLDSEYIWQSMYRRTLPFGRKGVGMTAISAVDIAIWDAKGKMLNQPVFKLLGGRTKSKIPVYASRLYSQPLDDLYAEAKAYAEQGFKSVKLRFGWGPKDGLEGMRRNADLVRTAREAVGPNCDIMADAYMGWNLEYARRMLKMLAPFDMRWIEEPVIADDLHAYAELRALNLVNISGGEHEYTLSGFRDALALKAFDIAQFDVNRVGGVTAAKKIADLCEANDVLVVPHAGQMHNYHVTMSSYAAPIAEFFPKVPVEVGNELFWYIFDGEPTPKDGFIDLDDSRPGFGLTLKDSRPEFQADTLMPNFPIIDTHLHVWDQSRLRYSAFEGNPLFNHPYHVEDYQRDCGGLAVEAMVFLECYADFWEGGGQYIEEIEFVEDEQKRDPRIRGIVPMAPLEWGARVEPMLRRMRDEHPSVKGIRRIMEFDADPRALTLSDDFIAGVNQLEKFGWSFDINPNYTQMDIIREFVPRVSGGVPMILDHCGKPGIRQGAIDQYRDDVKTLARHANLWIKLSDLPPYAGPDWTPADLRPYIEATLDAFGPERTIYAGDYPILLQSTTLTQWVRILDEAFRDLGLSEAETRLIYRDNANRFYRLGL